jgi:hypothetical protein
MELCKCFFSFFQKSNQAGFGRFLYKNWLDWAGHPPKFGRARILCYAWILFSAREIVALIISDPMAGSAIIAVPPCGTKIQAAIQL